uniref:Uncharacterized protein n=1 Tax=Glossina austeni TaxID=7395 RepID=A0A1A9UX88_GLOAU
MMGTFTGDFLFYNDATTMSNNFLFECEYVGSNICYAKLFNADILKFPDYGSGAEIVPILRDPTRLPLPVAGDDAAAGVHAVDDACEAGDEGDDGDDDDADDDDDDDDDVAEFPTSVPFTLDHVLVSSSVLPKILSAYFKFVDRKSELYDMINE